MHCKSKQFTYKAMSIDSATHDGDDKKI